ncbi:centromere protein H (CENP-H)-domain-containing protein [Echria macrotheca]|uniref:Centromere protein H (CENP-H)-domain-containing protein n=1 Tax=Echria macrotheca TaxID=438768 RepID=A0AAJ0BI35_9PEZI|nr:centromere protein H (CENP-H)-domain-containing protein [Echria macrotheca]
MASAESRSPRLSPTEARVLELYNKLCGLQLELALLKARQDHTSGVSETRDAGVDELQLRVLEAKTALELRNSVIENVVMVHPTLKAVHNATQTSPVERDLLPYIHQREVAGKAAAKQYSETQAVVNLLVELELECSQIKSENAELAKEVFGLADIMRLRAGGENRSARHGAEITGLENQLKVSRQRWKVMKGVVSAIVAGSGMDWPRDARLREMVLDTGE